jgi:hypothetical protein
VQSLLKPGEVLGLETTALPQAVDIVFHMIFFEEPSMMQKLSPCFALNIVAPLGLSLSLSHKQLAHMYLENGEN